MSGLSVQLPLNHNEVDGLGLNKTYLEVIKQNIKMVLLTRKGSRIMHPNFGLSSFLFEVANGETLGDIEAEIREQMGKYVSMISIDELKLNIVKNNNVDVYIAFSIDVLGVSSSLSTTIFNTGFLF